MEQSGKHNGPAAECAAAIQSVLTPLQQDLYKLLIMLSLGVVVITLNILNFNGMCAFYRCRDSRLRY